MLSGTNPEEQQDPGPVVAATRQPGQLAQVERGGWSP